MSLTLTFKLEMRSDYHVGAGHGRGTELDSALLRDADGAPVLRGTVLNGLLRDGLWRLLQLEPLTARRLCPASGLPEDEYSNEYCGQYAPPGHTAELCPICRLFGTPRYRKRWQISSARPIDQPVLAGTSYQPDELSGQRVTRVRVNPRTRRAAARHLFSEEHGGRQVFTFTAICPNDGDDVLDEAALLVAAARFVRELGRGRRRGQGESLISLVEVNGLNLGVDPQRALLNRFEKHWLEGNPTPLSQTHRESLEEDLTLGPVQSHPFRLWLLVRLEDPLLVAERAAAGNRFQGRDCIPGTVLRGALANWAAQALDLEDDATYQAFLHLFVRDGIRFPTLYPLQREKSFFYPAIPMPRDAFACKVYSYHSLEWGTKGQGAQCSTCNSPTKAVRGKFYPLRTLDPQPFKSEQRVEMHIRIDPQTGRVEEGQLFDYVPLEAGQYFVGELRCTDKETWELLQAFTGLAEKEPFDLQLGRATRRGYGRITLWATDRELFLWELLPLQDRVPQKQEELTVILLTDTIVQDAWGRFATGFDAIWLAEEMGFPVSIIEERAFAGKRMADGFNTQWHLPRWRAVALEAGSSARLRLEEPVTPELQRRLRHLEQEGIGERRNEGYGRVIFNHPLYENFTGLQKSTSVTIPTELGFADKDETLRESRSEWQDKLEEFATDYRREWQQLQGEGQPLTALARWLLRNRHQEISVLVEEIANLGQADDDLKSMIRKQGRSECEDEYGDRPQKNRLEEKKAIELVQSLLRELEQKRRSFWPEGIHMIASWLSDLTKTEKEA